MAISVAQSSSALNTAVQYRPEVVAAARSDWIAMIEKNLLAIDALIRGLATLPRNFFGRVAALTVVCVAVTWIGSGIVFDIRATDRYKDELQLAKNNLASISDSLVQTIQRLRGIASTIAQNETARNVLLQLNVAAPRRTRVGPAGPAIRKLDEFLQIAAENLTADLIWIVDANGNAVASSDAALTNSIIGTTVADREYFRAAQAGKAWQQYTVGRQTGIAGLYFSYPVIENGNFLGAAIIKWNAQRLSAILAAENAFIVDGAGVIISAREKDLELRAIPESTIDSVPPAEKIAQYGRTDVRKIDFNWQGDTRFSSIASIADKNQPLILVSRHLAEQGATVFVGHPFDDLRVLGRERYIFFALLSIAGILAIIALNARLLLRESNRREKIAAENARRAQVELQDRMQEEQHVAKGILEGAVMGPNVRPAALAARLAPATTFNGDLLLSAYTPSGDLHVLVGDFTGHGLVATIGAIPVAETFRAMTGKGFAPAPILDEINRKLRGLLPTGRFLAAMFVRVERSLTRASVINCGMPEAWLVRGARVDACFKSMSLPLAVTPRGDYAAAEIAVEISSGDRIFIASDGATEALNPEGQMLGLEGLGAAILQSLQFPQPLAAVVQSIDEFCRGLPLVDDATLVDIHLVDELFLTKKQLLCSAGFSRPQVADVTQCISAGCRKSKDDILACVEHA